MAGEAKIVVGARHDDTFSVDKDLRILGRVNPPEEEIGPVRFQSIGDFVNLGTFFENIHSTTSFS
jgi:hypothetical protein